MSNLYYIICNYNLFYRFFELLGKGDWENLNKEFGYDINSGKPLSDWLLEEKYDINVDEYLDELMHQISKTLYKNKLL